MKDWKATQDRKRQELQDQRDGLIRQREQKEAQIQAIWDRSEKAEADKTADRQELEAARAALKEAQERFGKAESAMTSHAVHNNTSGIIPLRDDIKQIDREIRHLDSELERPIPPEPVVW